MNGFSDKVSFIWSVADLLRGPTKPPQYGRVILPLTVRRRLDCVLEPTTEKALAEAEQLKCSEVGVNESALNRIANASFHNTSRLDFKKLKGEPDIIAANLTAYIKGFSSPVRDIFEKFNFGPEIARLEENDRLYLVVSRFADIDLHPDRVKNIEMGFIVRGTHPAVQRSRERDGGRPLHPPRSHPLIVNLLFAPEPRSARQERRRPHPVRPRLRRRHAPHQRRLLPVPPAHDLEDEAGQGRRQPYRHRVQRLAPVHGRRGRLLAFRLRFLASV